jgi:hypothetical protein
MGAHPKIKAWPSRLGVGHETDNLILLRNSKEMFKYLGSFVSNTHEVEREIKARIIAGNKCFHALGHLLKKGYRTHSLGVGLYKTVIRQVVTYGAESCTLTNKMERALMTWERKILRRIYGPTYGNGYWRIKMNQEIDNLHQPTTALIKIYLIL